MLFLKTDAALPVEIIDAIREQVKEHTGEDCVILTNGLTVERIPVKKDKAVSRKRLPRWITSKIGHRQKAE